MLSILSEIAQLRRGRPFVIDRTNTNRYCVLLQEEDGSRTAYYFSAPLYNLHTRKAVDLKFKPGENRAHLTGSNAQITVSDTIRLENPEGCCVLYKGAGLTGVTKHKLSYGGDILLPTTNGVAYKAVRKDGAPIRFDLEVGKPSMEVRSNDKYFALMSETFRPFVIVSAIGTVNADGEVIAPATVSYQRVSDCRCRLTVTPCSPFGEGVMFECNLYEPKLLQDTTVESRNPNTNNAFGGTAFIGSTALFGEQWLYARPDVSKFSGLTNKRIRKAILHLPKHNGASVELRASQVMARFCSFGSNWNNKIAAGGTVTDTVLNSRYQDLDVTALLTNPQTGYMTYTDGWILRPRVKDSGFSVIATGDSCYAPQIFEINFK